MASEIDKYKKYLTNAQVKALTEKQQKYNNAHADERVQMTQSAREQIDAGRRMLQNRGLASSAGSVISGEEPRLRARVQTPVTAANEELRRVESQQLENAAVEEANKTIAARNAAAQAAAKKREEEEAERLAAEKQKQQQESAKLFGNGLASSGLKNFAAAKYNTSNVPTLLQAKAQTPGTAKTNTEVTKKMIGLAGTKAEQKPSLLRTSSDKAAIKAATSENVLMPQEKKSASSTLIEFGNQRRAEETQKEGSVEGLRDEYYKNQGYSELEDKLKTTQTDMSAAKALETQLKQQLRVYERPGTSLAITPEQQKQKNELQTKLLKTQDYISRLEASEERTRKHMEQINTDWRTQEAFLRYGAMTDEELEEQLASTDEDARTLAYRRMGDIFDQNNAMEEGRKPSGSNAYSKELEDDLMNRQNGIRMIQNYRKNQANQQIIQSAQSAAAGKTATPVLAYGKSRDSFNSEKEWINDAVRNYNPDSVGETGSVYYKAVNDKDAIEALVKAASGDTKYLKGDSENPVYDAYEYARYMKPDEINTFNVLYKEQGGEAADKYFEALLPTLDQRGADKISDNARKFAKNYGLLADIASVPINLATGMIGPSANVGSSLSGKGVGRMEAAALDFGGIIREQRQEGMSDTGRFIYGTGMSIADSMVAALLTGGGGDQLVSLGGLALGGSAYNSTYREALDRGLDTNHAQATALAAGVFEMMFEEMSLEKLVKIKDAASIAEFALNALKQAGFETSEEVNTEIANIIADAFINTDTNKLTQQYNQLRDRGYSDKEAHARVAKDTAGEVIMAGVGGFVSGGFMGGGATAIQTGVQATKRYFANNYSDAAQLGKKVKANGWDAELAEYQFEDKGAAELKDRGNLSNQELGYLYAIMKAEQNAGAVGREVRSGEGGVQALQTFKYENESLRELAGKENLTDSDVSKLYTGMQEQLHEVTSQRLGSEGKDALNIFDKISYGEGITTAEARKIADNAVAASVFNSMYGSDARSYKTNKAIKERANELAAKNRSMYGMQERAENTSQVTAPAQSDSVTARLTEDQRRLAAQPSEADKKGTVETRRGNVSYEYNEANSRFLTDRQKAAVSFAQAVANATGANIKVVDSMEANGMYDKATNTLTIALDSDRGVLNTASHELTHWLAENDPEGYAAFAKLLEEEVNKTDLSDLDALPDDVQAWIRENNQGEPLFDTFVKYEQSRDSSLSEEDAREEAVAECCEPMLSSMDVQRRLASENLSTAKKVRDYLKRIYDNIDALLRGKNWNSREAKIMQSEMVNLKKIENAWADAISKAGKNRQTQQQKTGVKYQHREEIQNALESNPATREDCKYLDMLDSRNLSRFYIEVKSMLAPKTKAWRRALIGKPSDLLAKHMKSVNLVYIGQKAIIKTVYSKNENSGGKHGLGIEMIEELPFQLYDPLAITGPTSKHESEGLNYIVVWTEFKTNRGDPIVAPVSIDIKGDTGLINNVDTIFEVFNKAYLSDLIREGNILYTRDNKNIGELLSHEPKELEPHRSDIFNTIMSQSDESVKPKLQKRDDQYSDLADKYQMGNASKAEEKTLQKLVQEAAKEHGYTLQRYHGTDADFTVFDTSISGGKKGKAEGFGIYLTDSQEISSSYGKNQLHVYAKIEHPATSYKKTIKQNVLAKLIESTCEEEAKTFVDNGDYSNKRDALRDTWISNYVNTYDMPIKYAYQEVAKSIIRMSENDMSIVQEVMAGMGIRDYADANKFYEKHLTPVTGIDGFETTWKGGNKITLAFRSEQIKSADLVTYDNEGKAIPLSERFTNDNPDIRYQKRDEADMAPIFEDETESEQQTKPRTDTADIDTVLDKQSYKTGLDRLLARKKNELKEWTKKTSTTEGKVFKEKDVKKLTADLIRTATSTEQVAGYANVRSTMNRQQIAERLALLAPRVWDSLHGNTDVGNTWEDTRKLVADILQSVEGRDVSRAEDLALLRSNVPQTIYLNEVQEQEVKNTYGNIYAYAKKLKAALGDQSVVVRKATASNTANLDADWKNITEGIAGDYADISDADEPLALLDIASGLRSSSGRIYKSQTDIERAAEQMTDALMSGVIELVPTEQNVTTEEAQREVMHELADRASFFKKKVDQLENRYDKLNREYEEARKENRADIRDYEKKLENLQKELKQSGKMIEGLEKKIREMDNRQVKDMARELRGLRKRMERELNKSNQAAQKAKDEAETNATALAMNAAREAQASLRTELESQHEAEMKKMRSAIAEETARGMAAAREALAVQRRAHVKESLAKERKAYAKGKSDTKEQLARKNLQFTIAKNLDKLASIANHPNKNQHVPVELMEALRSYMQTLSNYALDPNKAMDSKSLVRLRDAYTNLEFEGEGVFAVIQDQVIKEQLQALVNITEKKPYEFLTSDELKMVRDTVNAVTTEITNANKLVGRESKEGIYEQASALIKEMRDAEPLKGGKYLYRFLSPIRFARAVTNYKSNAVLVEEMEELNKGAIEKERIAMEGNKLFADFISKYGKEYEKWQGKHAEWIDTGWKGFFDDKPVYITPAMKLSLIMHARNNQNMNHIIKGGITVPNVDLYKKGKIADAYNKGQRVLISAGEIKNLELTLTDAEKAYLRCADEFFNTYAPKAINKTSLELYGYRKAQVKNYFPIRTDANFNRTNFENVIYNGSIEGMGMLKERVDHAANPIMLEDISSAVKRQIENTALFSGLAIPVRNFTRIFNTSLQGYEDSVKATLSNHLGEDGMKVLEKILTDLQTKPKGDSYKRVLGRLQSGYVQATLAVNLSVTMKQAASYPTAAAVVGWKPLLKALAKGGRSGSVISRADMDLIDRYTPLLYIRQQGMIDRDVADYKVNGKTWAEKMPGLMDWIRKVDVATVGRLWYAAEYYVQDANPDLIKGSEAYYQETANVFNRIVQETQPNYTVMQRPDVLRTESDLMRSITMFKTQAFQNGGIILDAIGEFKATRSLDVNDAKRIAANRKLANMITSQVVQNVVLTGMTLLANAITQKMNPWRDDDDEITPESIANNFALSMVSNTAGSFWIGSELFDVIMAGLNKATGKDIYAVYDKSSPVTDVINDLRGSIESLGKAVNMITNGEKDSWDDYRKQLGKIATGVSELTGVPYKNIMKLITGAENWYKDIKIATKTGEIDWFRSGSKAMESEKTAAAYKTWTNAGNAGKTYFYYKSALKGYTADDKRIALMDAEDLTPDQKAMLENLLIYSGSKETRVENGAFQVLNDDGWSTVTNYADPTMFNLSKMSDSRYENAQEMIAAGIKAETVDEAWTHYLQLDGSGKTERFRQWLMEQPYTADEKATIDKYIIGNKTVYDYTNSYSFATSGMTESQKEKTNAAVKAGVPESIAVDAMQVFNKKSMTQGMFREWLYKQNITAAQKAALDKAFTGKEIVPDYTDTAWLDVYNMDSSSRKTMYGKAQDAYKEVGLEPSTFAGFYEIYKTIDGKDANGKTSKGLKRQRIQDLIQSLGLTKEQRAYMYSHFL